MTNAIPVLQQAAQSGAAAQSAIDAWHVVALGAGALIVHGYHVIVQAGGIKNIFKAFWNGK